MFRKLFHYAWIGLLGSALALVCGVHHAVAAELFLQSNAQVAHIGQEFYVDVMLDPADDSVNALSVAITLPQGVSWIGASDDGSIIGTWIERPHRTDDTVVFSGIIPNGFTGFIDPENPGTKKSGRVVRLVVRGETAGSGIIAVTHADAYANDGEGSSLRVVSAPFAVKIDQTVMPIVLAAQDRVPPEIIDAQIVRDRQFFEGKPAAIFDVRDTGSGIVRTEIREGVLPWRPASSPERLTTTLGLFMVHVRAFDAAGNVTIVDVPVPRAMRTRSIIECGVAILVIVGACVILIYRKKRL